MLTGIFVQLLPNLDWFSSLLSDDSDKAISGGVGGKGLAEIGGRKGALNNKLSIVSGEGNNIASEVGEISFEGIHLATIISWDPSHLVFLIVVGTPVAQWLWEGDSNSLIPKPNSPIFGLWGGEILDLSSYPEWPLGPTTPAACWIGELDSLKFSKLVSNVIDNNLFFSDKKPFNACLSLSLFAALSSEVNSIEFIFAFRLKKKNQKLKIVSIVVYFF